jgi:ParB family transcriptional regulator, chromosome partitioning protein
MQRKRSGLGRGLDALIPTGEQKPDQPGILLVEHQNIKPNPHQPRTRFPSEELDELAASIKEHGIIQPLIVTRSNDPETYTLIAGERRLQAARLVGLASVPVIVREASEQQYLELALIENIQRADLNPLEAAEAYRQLAEDFSLSHDEIAERVGKSRTAITNTLRLLKLPQGIQKAILDGQISEGHARALLALPTPQAQHAALQTILQNSLNVRQTEDLVRKYSGQKPSSSIKPVLPPEFKHVEDKLRSHLGTRVRLSHGERGGSITIHYYSDEELEGILTRILGDSSSTT